MDRINMAVGEQRGIELGGLFGVAIKPKARGNARHRDSPTNSGGAGGLIDPLSFEHLRRLEGHAPRARLKAHSRHSSVSRWFEGRVDLSGVFGNGKSRLRDRSAARAARRKR